MIIFTFFNLVLLSYQNKIYLEIKMKDIKLIAFDADDTLWVNEPHYREAEFFLKELLSAHIQVNDMGEEIYKNESQNIHLYGYGAKGFTLSMIETAIKLTHGKINQEDILKIIEYGKKLMDYPITLLPNVIETIKILNKHYRLIMITKGDLIDQERKIRKSKLEKYFEAIEIVSEKSEEMYSNLIQKYKVEKDEFLMIGNSIRSDIKPVLAKNPK